jgi:hypothetical protein
MTEGGKATANRSEREKEEVESDWIVHGVGVKGMGRELEMVGRVRSVVAVVAMEETDGVWWA